MRTTFVRVTSFLGGVLLSAYMYLLVTATDLGSSPLFVFEEGIAALTGGLLLRVTVLVLATHLMALGGALVVRAAFGAAAIDAVMLGLSSVLRRDTARVRTVMEVALAVGGAALGGKAGLGTIVAGLTVGHSFGYWARRLGIAQRGSRHGVPRARENRRCPARTFRPLPSIRSSAPAPPLRDSATPGHLTRALRTGT